MAEPERSSPTAGAAWKVGFELGNTRLEALGALALVRCVTFSEQAVDDPT